MAYVHNRLSEIHQNKLCFLTLRSNRGQNRPLKGPFLLKINLPGYPPVKNPRHCRGSGRCIKTAGAILALQAGFVATRVVFGGGAAAVPAYKTRLLWQWCPI